MKRPSLLDGYLSEPELCKQLDISERTAKRWRDNLVGPDVTFISRWPYYRIEAVQAWLQSKEKKMVRNRRANGERRAMT